MESPMFWTVFLSVLLAELGDKTQLATLLFAADPEASKWTVFWAASAALVISSALGVVAGAWLSSVLPPRALQTVAGIGFVVIGLWTLLRG